MAFWLTIALFVASFVATTLLTKGPKIKPGDPEAPKADEGEPTPVLWGTVKVTPNCVWFGDVRRKRIKDGDLKRVTVGFQYFAGLELVLGWGPIDELVEVYVAEHAMSERGPHREVIGYTGPYNSDPIYSDPTGAVSPALPLAPADVNASTLLTLKDATLFGAKKREGGIGGNASLFWGGLGQNGSGYLSTHVVAGSTTAVSTHPGKAYVVVEGMYLGNSPQVGPFAFAVRRFPNTLSAAAGHPEWARIGDDANPAEMLYELLTEPRWGFGYAAGDEIDVDAFTAAAQALYEEGFGLSGAITARTTGADMVREIERHVDGVLDESPTTGKLTLTLVRPDYAAALAAGALPVLDDSNTADVVVDREVGRGLVSSVTVRYTDRARNYRTGEVPWNNPATHFATEGQAQVASYDFPLCHTGAAARVVAERLARAGSVPLPKLTGTVDRRLAALARGGVVVANFPDKGLGHAVMRLATVDYGDLEDGRIRIEATQDVFEATGAVYVAPPPPAGVDAPLAPSDGQLEVTPARQETATTGTVILTVEDPDAVVTAVEFRTTVGGGTAGAWTAVSEPYAKVITRDATRDTLVEWRVLGDVDGEAGAELAEGAETFAPAQTARPGRIDLKVDGTTGAVTATVVAFDSVATQAKCAGATSDYPADATVDAAAPDTAAPFAFALGTLAVGETMYAKAVLSDGTTPSPYFTDHITRGTPLLGGSPCLAVLREATGLESGDYLDILLPPGTIIGVRVDADVAADFALDFLAVADPGPAGPPPDFGAAASLAGGPVTVSSAAYYADDALAGWTVAVPVRTWVRVQVVTGAPGLRQLSALLLLQRA